MVNSRIRYTTVIGIALCLSGCPIFLAATTTATAAPNARPHARDSKALQIVQQSVAKMGGLDQIRSVRTWMATADQSLPDKSASSLTLLVAGAEIRQETTIGGETNVFTTGHGHAGLRNSSGIHPMYPHVTHALFVPLLVPKYLQRCIDDNNYSLEYLGADNSGNSMVRIISHETMIDEAVTSQTWYFDSSSELPVKVVYRIPDAHIASRYGLATAALDDYRPVEGISLPFAATVSLGAQVLRTIHLKEVQINTPVSDNEFAPLSEE